MDEKNIGAMTGVRLDDVRPLLQPWRMGPFGQLMPPLRMDAARLSVELAVTAYSMDASPWLQAGWRDVTVQMENRLREGIEQAEEEQSAHHGLASALKRQLARHELTRRDPLSAVAGSLRQWNRESDTCKALVMLHPAPGGRYVVAIGFMGTGNVQDWIANLRVDLEAEMHQGFDQLTRQFEGNEEEIHFPETARELGLEDLTLADILEEARHPGSRFLIWAAGHSQGGALVQLYVHRKLRLDGVLPQHLLGYAFAAPKPVTGRFTPLPSAYPIYLFENSDDPVPRSGALVHLGVRLIYPMTDPVRDMCYGWHQDEASVRQRELVAPILARMTDMPRILEHLMAYLRVLEQLPVEESVEGLAVPILRQAAKRLALAADAGLDAAVRVAARRCADVYAQLTGGPMPESQVQEDQAIIAEAVARLGVRAFSAALRQMATAAHSATPRPAPARSVYPFITMQSPACFDIAVWTGGEQPEVLRAGKDAGAALSSPIFSALTVARRAPRETARTPRRPHGGRTHLRGAPKRRPSRAGHTEEV